ncbi:hypothetical protein B0O80DRAFT_491311 [Mortierella sp. GBAus27b]|nr:hypothetical protein B0O80DRAFT_491311 [Mortierella sp. GBAus27b]
MVADKTLVVLGDLTLATEDLGKGVEQYAEVHHTRPGIQWHLSTIRDVLDPSNANRVACEEAAQKSALACGRFHRLQFRLMAETNPRVVRFRSRALSTCALTRSKRLLLGGVCADGCLVEGEDDLDEEEEDGETAAAAAMCLLASLLVFSPTWILTEDLERQQKHLLASARSLSSDHPVR